MRFRKRRFAPNQHCLKVFLRRLLTMKGYCRRIRGVFFKQMLGQPKSASALASHSARSFRLAASPGFIDYLAMFVGGIGDAANDILAFFKPLRGDEKDVERILQACQRATDADVFLPRV